MAMTESTTPAAATEQQQQQQPQPPPPDSASSSEQIAAETVPPTTCTSSSAIPTDDEHEEGEIDDDDEEEGAGDGLEYEDISSEEEITIRERIAELEAMDAKLRQKKGSGRTSASCPEIRKNNAYDKPSVISLMGKDAYECISDEEDVELYLQRYEPLPKPKLLPARRKPRSLRSSSGSKAAVASAVVIGSRSSASVRRHGSGSSAESRRRIAKRKYESMMGTRGGRGNTGSGSGSSSLKMMKHKRRRQHAGSSSIVNICDSSESEREFPLDRARLQAACNINAGKRKTDKENWDALKQKLQLSMKKRQKQQQQQQQLQQEASKEMEERMVLVEDDEDEEEDEEVLQLRLQALKTKAELKESGVVNLLEEPPSAETIAEERELRMIALRSAFTKKAQIRQRKKQEERPYSPSDELLLLSPVREELSPPIEEMQGIVEEEDDDVLIIETRTETVEIADSSSDEADRMDISRSASPHCPEPPDIRAVDMELATSGESRSPITTITSRVEELPVENEIPDLIIDDLQSKLPEEDDEESLRNQLLSNLSVTALRPVSVPIEELRPMTPDSMGEEEAEALRELIISKMNNKKASNVQAQPQTESAHIPNDSQQQPELQPAVPACPMEPLSVCTDSLPPATLSGTSPIPVLTATTQSKAQSNPNLITLIGRKKVPRKKRKSKTIHPKPVPIIPQPQPQLATPVVINANPIALAMPRPSRTFIKAPSLQVHIPPLPSSLPPPPTIVTKKLVNNPNKLINVNTTIPAATVPSDKRSSTLLENYIQKPVPKLIIQLGQSDSDSDPDYYPAPDPETPEESDETERRLQETFLRDLDNASPSRVTLESPALSPSGFHHDEFSQDGSSRTTTPEVPESEPAAGQQNVTNVAFERRLDEYLKTVRSKIDQSKSKTNEDETASGGGVGGVTAKRTGAVPTVGSGNGSSVGTKMATTIATRIPVMAPPAPMTPSAVRHLPKSAQLEYRRLVARMAQLEKQKHQRNNNNHLPSPLTKTIQNIGPEEEAAARNKSQQELVVTLNRDRRDVRSNQLPKRDSEPLVKRVLINNTVIAEAKSHSAQDTSTLQPTKETKEQSTNGTTTSSNRSRESVNGGRGSDHEVSSLRRRLASLNDTKRQKVLAIAEQRFERHSHRFAQELQDLISTVEHAQEERQKQHDLENKVAFLKEKLMVLERALSLHKDRLGNIFPALQESHTKVMASRKKSIELNNICLTIGREVKGQNYNPPSNARNEIHEQLKVLTTETKRLKDMKKLSLDEFKQLTAEQRRKHQHPHQQQEQEIHESPAVVIEVPSPEPVEPVSPLAVGVAVSSLPVGGELQDRMEYEEKEEEPVPNADEERLPFEAEDIGTSHYCSAQSAPTSRTASPTMLMGEEQPSFVIQEAPAVLAFDPQSRFEKYTSPLASLKTQSALNIPDGVICPYQMRGECVDQDCVHHNLSKNESDSSWVLQGRNEDESFHNTLSLYRSLCSRERRSEERLDAEEDFSDF